MRLTTVILLASLLQVSAATFGQKITLNKSNVSLESLFREIRKQSGYNFFYDGHVLTPDLKGSIRVSDASIDEALKNVLNDLPFTYEIKDRTILITKKAVPSFLDNLVARFSDIDVRGKIVGEQSQVLAGATVKVKGTNRITKSNEKGEFYLANVEDDAVLEISYIGFKALEIPVKGAVMPLKIKLNLATGELEEVKVVYNTGYQNIDKTRATGSFVQVDNELINRKVGTDILSRLEGVVPGLLFDRRPGIGGAVRQNLQIRGLYTLTEAISQPLIVVDNFPFAGNLLDINPNDVENITILKDAAAASIWGARAGNGVIVITTKKGNYNQKFQISLNSNITAIAKPDLFKINDMSVNDYVDMERFLFDKGQYNGIINDPVFGVLTPVQEILLHQQKGDIDKVQADAQIDNLRQYDVRNDFMKYLYRDEVKQQYSINLSGGGNNIKYTISGGLDKNLSNLKGDQYNRISFRSNTTISPIKQLQLGFRLAYTQGNNENNNPGGYGVAYRTDAGVNLYSYARLADDDGNSLALDRSYRKSYTDTVGNGKLLDWKYRPIDEMNYRDNTSINRNLVGDFNVQYDLYKGLIADISYQYQRSTTDQNLLFTSKSFVARDLINRFTQIKGNEVKYVIPNEGFLDETNSQSSSQSLRAGLRFNRSWNDKHEISAIGGGEIRQTRSVSSSNRIYSYNERLNFANIDYVNEYPVYPFYGGTSTIPNTTALSGFTDRYVSLYGNASYTYNKKYTFSASARRDASNLFGVKTNDKGTPLWSIGGLWNVGEEAFYKIALLPVLKARITYGYSGNVNNQAGTALTVITYNPTSVITNLPSAWISRPGTPSLRWEKVNTFNAGIDFALKNQILSGSIEYYRKKSTDVIAPELLDYTRGVNSIPTNSANITGTGIDIQLNSQIINKGPIGYRASLGFSNVKYEVTKYMGSLGLVGTVSDGLLIQPYSNPYSIISFRWAGLDPITGDPQGILNGNVSKDYNQLIATSLKDNVTHGSALPKFYGNMLNTFSIYDFTLSANITYKLGYYFIKPTIQYDQLFKSARGHSDYNNRWQKPGDELTTNVPSMVYGSLNARDAFYAASEVLVERADHIRLDDIRLSYNLPRLVINKLKMNSLQFYGYFSNLNILLYKSNKAGLDPQYPNGLTPEKSISFGLIANF